jgi:phage-related protein
MKSPLSERQVSGCVPDRSNDRSESTKPPPTIPLPDHTFPASHPSIARLRVRQELRPDRTRQIPGEACELSHMCYKAFMRWSVETVSQADDEIAALPRGLQARLVRLLEMVENLGLENLHEPHVKHLEGKLWELRVKAGEGIARGLYVTMTGKRVVVLHVFMKKSQKTPLKALDIARSRMKEVMS